MQIQRTVPYRRPLVIYRALASKLGFKKSVIFSYLILKTHWIPVNAAFIILIYCMALAIYMMSYAASIQHRIAMSNKDLCEHNSCLERAHEILHSKMGTTSDACDPDIYIDDA